MHTWKVMVPGPILRADRPICMKKMLHSVKRLYKVLGILTIGGIIQVVLYYAYFSGKQIHQRTSLYAVQDRDSHNSSLHFLIISGQGLDNKTSATPYATKSKDVYHIDVEISQNPNITARGKWQVEQVQKFCKKHKFVTKYDISLMVKSSTQIFRHLLFDDQRHIVFCFIPKVGCRNMRRLLLVMQGLLPVETAKNVSSPRELDPKSRKISFENKRLTDSERLKRLQNYYKFVMIRNPLERLVSAYRDKIEPFVRKHNEKTKSIVNRIKYDEGVLFFENHKHFILSHYRPLDLLHWRDTGGTLDLQVSFSDFIQWIINTEDTSLNEHFSSQLTNSQPCMVKYDFYPNFKNYSRDVRLLLKKFDASEEYFADHSTHTETGQTRLLLHHYYSHLSQELRQRLFERMFVELDFYYHLNPEEQFSHTDILGIAEPVLLY